MSWDGLKNKKPIPAKSIDGYVRSADNEVKLNKAFAARIQRG